MGARGRRPCRFCKRWFRPHPRLGPRQYACSTDECQSQRQAENEGARIERDPGYWRGRKVKHHEYRKAHPEVNRRWREAHPEAVARDREARRDRHHQEVERCAAEHKAIALQLTPAKPVEGGVTRAAEHKAIVAQARMIMGLVCQVTRAAEHKSIVESLVEMEDHGRRLLGGGHGKSRTG